MAADTMARYRAHRFTALAGAMTAAAVVATACGGPTGQATASSSSSSVPVSTVRVPATTAPSATAAAAPSATAPAATVPAPAPATAPAVHATSPASSTSGAQPVAEAAACQPGLASRLASTGSARQLITVESSGYGTTHATVQTWQLTGACWVPVAGPWSARIGQNGFSDHTVEGAATTPTGRYGIGPTMYGNAADPGVQEPYHQLVCGDWWDEDPSSPGYNTFQHVACGTAPPFGGGSQALWTEPQPYPSFAVIDYNTAPAVPYAGSAVFLEADTGSATDGCVSLPLAQLDQLLRWIDPADSPAVVMGPAQEITSF